MGKPKPKRNKEKVNYRIDPLVRQRALDKMDAQMTKLGPKGVRTESALANFLFERFADDKVDLD